MDSEIDVRSVSAMRITFTDGSTSLRVDAEGSTSASLRIYGDGVVGAIVPPASAIS